MCKVVDVGVITSHALYAKQQCTVQQSENIKVAYAVGAMRLAASSFSRSNYCEVNTKNCLGVSSALLEVNSPPNPPNRVFLAETIGLLQDVHQLSHKLCKLDCLVFHIERQLLMWGCLRSTW